MSMPRLMAKAAGLMIVLGAGQMTALHAQRLETDQQFVNKVAASNLLEVRLAQFAQTKAQSPAVKEFGQRMVVDHTASQKQWMEIAKKNGIVFKADLSPQQVAQAEQLKNLSGAAFDRSYMSLMVQNHRDNVAAFQNERNAAHSADVRQLIETSLPTLQGHVSLAQQIGSQVGADMTATAGGQPTTTTPVVAQPGQPAQPAQSVRADSVFIAGVDASNAAELRLARMAQSKAREPVVKSFADRMVTDHDRMQKEWVTLSSRYGVRFSGNLSPQHQAQVTRLDRLSGTEFDRAYMAAMTQNHRENVNTFQTTGRSTQSAEVRQLVERSLPSLQEHLALAREVSSRVGSDAAPTVASSRDQGKNGNVKEDAKFVRNVDAVHYLEIRLGRLAERKAQDASVKQFGRRMAEDHTSLQTQWSSMTANNGMKFKSGMGPRHRSKLTRQEKLSGREFDREYMTLVLQNNQDYLDYFRKEGRAANSAPVRNLVNRGIPILEQHLREGKQIGARVGADTNTTDSRYGRISIKDRDKEEKDKPKD